MPRLWPYHTIRHQSKVIGYWHFDRTLQIFRKSLLNWWFSLEISPNISSESLDFRVINSQWEREKKKQTWKFSRCIASIEYNTFPKWIYFILFLESIELNGIDIISQKKHIQKSSNWTFRWESQNTRNVCIHRMLCLHFAQTNEKRSNNKAIVVPFLQKINWIARVKSVKCTHFQRFLWWTVK